MGNQTGNVGKAGLIKDIGRQVGAAIAKDAIAEGMPLRWSGLDAQDGDRFTAVGLIPDTDEWVAAEAAARDEYERLTNPQATCRVCGKPLRPCPMGPGADEPGYIGFYPCCPGGGDQPRF
jgi:hypothetical protein